MSENYKDNPEIYKVSEPFLSPLTIDIPLEHGESAEILDGSYQSTKKVDNNSNNNRNENENENENKNENNQYSSELSSDQNLIRESIYSVLRDSFLVVDEKIAQVQLSQQNLYDTLKNLNDQLLIFDDWIKPSSVSTSIHTSDSVSVSAAEAEAGPSSKYPSFEQTNTAHSGTTGNIVEGALSNFLLGRNKSIGLGSVGGIDGGSAGVGGSGSISSLGSIGNNGGGNTRDSRYLGTFVCGHKRSDSINSTATATTGTMTPTTAISHIHNYLRPGRSRPGSMNIDSSIIIDSSIGTDGDGDGGGDRQTSLQNRNSGFTSTNTNTNEPLKHQYCTVCGQNFKNAIDAELYTRRCGIKIASEKLYDSKMKLLGINQTLSSVRKRLSRLENLAISSINTNNSS